MQIAANKAVSIDYTLTNEAGEVIDSSAGGAPLVYLHGSGNIIAGLEKALEGKQGGDEVKVSIEPQDAYGEYSPELVATLNRAMFEGVDEQRLCSTWQWWRPWRRRWRWWHGQWHSQQWQQWQHGRHWWHAWR